MELIDVVKKLTGKIQPIGESTEDANRYNNLLSMCSLVDGLIHEICLISLLKDHYQGSLMKAGKFADEFLQDLKN